MTDSRYVSIVGRRRHRAELDALIGRWTSQLDHQTAMERLQRLGIAAAAVLNPRELFRDKHLRQRGFWESTTDYSAGEQEYTGRPMRLSQTPYGGRTPTPGLGQHNREILGELLGMEDTELDALEAESVIGTEPILSASGGMAVAR
jgi:crotonobetainyl-CoA:carnitine CoA-transferase CaiB-like acyl-CoA transferase